MCIRGVIFTPRFAMLGSAMEPKPTIYIDVRRPEEYAAGHVPGAVNVSLEEHPDYIDQLLELARTHTLVLYCYSSVRSAYVQSLLDAKFGIPTDHMAGGLMLYQGPLAVLE